MKTAAKPRFSLPHPIILIYILVIAMVALTWLIPSGEYQRSEKTVSGTKRMVTVAGTYHPIPAKPVGATSLLTAPIRGFQNGIEIIVFLFIIGGAFFVIQETGAIDQAIRRMTAVFVHRPRWRGFLIPALMVVFSLAGSFFGMSEETIPFVMIFIPLALSLGYDSIVGIAIPFLGAAAGFAAAFFNPFTVGIAQGLSDLPLYSGLGYRFFVWVISTTVIITFVMLYAAKIRRNPQASPVYELDQERRAAMKRDTEEAVEWTGRQRAVLAVFLLGMAGLVVGILWKQWYIEEIAALFLALGVVAGLVGGLSPSRIAQGFVSGAKDMMGVAFVIACGRAILIVAQDGRILDTILRYTAGFISIFPRIVTAQIMFLTQAVINFFIHSGTAQASLTMPIMSPLSDLVGITRQTTVFAFQLCEFVNPILPTSAVTMGVLGVAKVPWEKWARWFLPLMVILILLSFVLLVPPVLTHWGPF